MSRKDIINKRFKSAMTKVRRALHNFPSSMDTCSEYRRFFEKTMKRLKFENIITDYTIVINKYSHEFRITYTTLYSNQVVIVDGEYE